MDLKELQKIVNPIYTTAKGTVMTLAVSGDKNAIALCPYLELEDIQKGNQALPEIIRKVYATAQEARFKIYNNAVLRRNEPVVVDLPSGYSPRGFVMADAKRIYYGFDLPSVIDLMKPAAAKTMTEEQKRYVTYAAADATNYDSLRNALGDIKGELCIVTEGLLGYFSESELISMCQAVNRLLSEFGGCWITADAGILKIYSAVYSILVNSDTAAFDESMKGHATRMSDAAFYQNSLFTKGNEGAVSFLQQQGFTVKSESVSSYISDLRTVDSDTTERIVNVCKNMDIWTMTLEKSTADQMDPNLPFAVESNFADGSFFVSVQGRLDTMTAPELLKKFQEIPEKAEEITIDVSRMAYVSSAGLRVFLMMYKSLGDKSRFKMIGVNEVVREILETTGFDQLLLCYSIITLC